MTNPKPSFELFNLKVEISEKSGKIIGKHKIGDYFEVKGEDIFIPARQGFSLYALSALLPLLPAKQRINNAHDWMATDWYVADPDSNCKAIYKISITGKTRFFREKVTAVPLSNNVHLL